MIDPHVLHVVLADPFSMMMVTTMVGAGISAYGQYSSGQAQSAMYKYQAGVNQQLAAVATQNANWDIVSGEVKAEQAGLQSAATLGRYRASAGAHGVLASPDVVRSQIAIGAENQAVARADAAHAAYGEQVQAAEKTATAGADIVAAGTARTAGEIGAVGSIVSGAGSVAEKWYTASQTAPSSSTPYSDLSGPVTSSFLEEG